MKYTKTIKAGRNAESPPYLSELRDFMAAKTGTRDTVHEIHTSTDTRYKNFTIRFEHG